MNPTSLSPLRAALMAFLLTLGATASAHAADRSERESEKLRKKADFWAFQPASRPGVPKLPEASGPGFGKSANPIDAFIADAWTKQGLHGSGPADRRTLARRIYFDLAGLPPTPGQLRAFTEDKSANAVERLVDQLLGSERYGERWARYWLDIVHFGESHGYDKDKPRPNAWPYRDYVIQAANEDMPYPRFVQEQLAGDVLFPEDPRATIATGFIVAGPWDFVGHVELPESKTDGLIARYNDRDDMVMTTMTTFQSLTVHCARCHDHKFDPIPQEDYYRLQAVFAGVDRADRAIPASGEFAKKETALNNEKAILEKTLQKIAAAKLAIRNEQHIPGSIGKQYYRDPRLQKIADRQFELGEITGDCAQFTSGREKLSTLGYHSAIAQKQEEIKWVQLDFPGELPIDGVALDPAFEKYGGHPGAGFGLPIRFRIDISNDPDLKQYETILDQTQEDYPFPNYGGAIVALGKKKSARHVRITGTKLFKRTDDYIFALGEVIVVSGGTNIAPLAQVRALDSIEAAPSWAKANLNDKISFLPTTQAVSRRQLGPGIRAQGGFLWWLEDQSRLYDSRIEEGKLRVKEEALYESLLPENLRDEKARTEKRLIEIEAELKNKPALRVVYSAANQFKENGNFKPAKKPRTVNFLKRGDVAQPVREVTPGALEFLAGLPADLEYDPAVEGTRRAALAKWLTRDDNFLLRRSIVNRVWQFHFGRGLVDSPNDFGHMGAAPSHPELLDWLAYWFMDHGESLKALHRLILTSAAYQQSSEDNAEFAKVDGDNRYLWRMNRARLDAESLHDAMLQISGQLDLKMGGPSEQQFFFKDDHSPIYDYTRFDNDSPGARRRSIYRFIVRTVPDPFFETLDCPDPAILTGKRNVTVTALQALATLNNPFVLKQSEHFAARLQNEAASLDAQIIRAFDLALNRAPSNDESARFAAYAQQHGLPNACRVIFNLSEFAFVD